MGIFTGRRRGQEAPANAPELGTSKELPAPPAYSNVDYTLYKVPGFLAEWESQFRTDYADYFQSVNHQREDIRMAQTTRHFSKGDKVRLTIEGVIKRDSAETFVFTHPMGDSFAYSVSRELATKAELVEAAKPAEPSCWPPQNGDVWRAADGKEFAIVYGTAFQPDDTAQRSYDVHPGGRDRMLTEHKGLTLVYRKGTGA